MTSKLRHDIINKYVMTSTGTSRVFHEVKSTSWCRSNVMPSMICHDVKKLVMTSKGTSWRPKRMSKIRHDVKNYITITPWHIKVCNDVKTFVMIYKVRHDVKSSLWRKTKSFSWSQKFRHDVKSSSLRQSYIMISSICNKDTSWR